MSEPLIIDSLINLFGLVGLLAMIAALRRRGADPMRARWTLALGLIAALYLLRGLYWLTAAPAFDRLTFLVALLVPIGALLLTEGLLRRHAPLAVKLLVPGSAALVLAGAAFGFGDAAVMLGAHVLASLLLIGLTIVFGMRGLAAGERRAIGALALCLLLLIPAALTDFRAILPDTPARLSPLALLIFGWVGLNSGLLDRRASAAILLLTAGTAAAAGFGLAAASTGLDPLAASAVIFAAMLLLSIGMKVRRAGEQKAGLRSRLAAAPLGSRDQVMAELAQDPLIGGAVLLTSALLAEHDLPSLRPLVLERPVLRSSEAPWGRSPTDFAVEGALTLFATYEASHLLLIDDQPLTLLAATVPTIAGGEDLETDITLAQRLIRLAPKQGAWA